MARLPEVVSIFARALRQEGVQPEIKMQIQGCVKALGTQHPQWAAMVQQLPTDQQQTLAEALR